MAFWLSVLILTLTLLAILYSYIQYKMAFWERRNVPYIKSTMPFGSIKGMGTSEHTSHMMQRFYHKLKGHGQIGGFFIATSPVVLAIDLDFVKHVLVKDFNSFQDRGVYYNERDDPLSAHLFSLHGYKWNRIRARLTPIDINQDEVHVSDGPRSGRVTSAVFNRLIYKYQRARDYGNHDQIHDGCY